MAERARTEEAEAARDRLRLLDRFRPTAFDAAGAALAARAGRFGSWPSRLLSAWWSFKAEVAGLYARGVPRTAVPLAELRELDAYHRRVELVRQLGQAYAGQLRSAAGAPDWEGTLEGLAQAQRLDRLVKVYPELKGTLTAGKPPDSDGLTARAGEMAHHARAAQAEYAELVRLLDRPAAPDGEVEPDQRGVAQFEGWATEMASEMDTGLERVELLARLLAPGADVRLVDVPDRVVAIERLSRLSGELGRLAAVAGLAPAGDRPDAPGAGGVPWRPGVQRKSRRSWTRDANGSWLIGLLDRHPSGLPAHLVGAASDPEYRAALAEAIRRNEAPRTPDLE